jgi:type III restriction enzyme
LPKSPGKFFPDFIVELLDGTMVIVEYKNAKLASNPDEQHKRDIGELWAQRSPDGYRFAWIVEGDWEKLKNTLKN